MFLIRGLKALNSTLKTHKYLHNIFTATASRHPDKPAILFEDQCWTFRKVDCFANKVAHFFLEQGLKKGDTVAMFMENCPEYIGLWLGLSKIGVKASFINYNLQGASLQHCLLICSPKAIVYSARLGAALKNVHEYLDESLQENIFFIDGEDKLVPCCQNLSDKLTSQTNDTPPPVNMSILGESLVRHDNVIIM